MMNEIFSFRRQSLLFVVSLTFLLLVWPRPCYAYLDPGTGSLIFSTIIGGIVGLMVTIKMAWHNILTFLRIRKRELDERSRNTKYLTSKGGNSPSMAGQTDPAKSDTSRMIP
jgi:hypothetical protein